MIYKYLLISSLILWWVTASDPHFGTDLSWTPIPKQKQDNVRELPWMSNDSFKDYLLDKDDRVSNRFPITNYYYPTVNFWFLIYTQFDASHVVIHDKTNLSMIYKVLDFSSLQAKDLPKNTLYVLQQKISDEKINIIKKNLHYLFENPFSLEPESKIIYRLLSNAGIKLPLGKLARAAFFNNLKNNIRTQAGQRNFIRDGIIRSLPYKPFLTKYFSEHNLPPELLAVPFLESSFNPKAESKVGALGVWQFMPLISSYYVPKKNLRYDYRSNIGVASVAAAFLMKENFQLMKSWDLAVTAYNSGTKHLLKTRRELAFKKTKIDLEMIIKSSDSQHFGFASKNFYSEFLALVHALAYEEELFNDIHKDDRYNVDDELHFYLLKCSLRLDKHLKRSHLNDILYHSHHIKDENKAYPRGLIVTSKENLPLNKFLKLQFHHLLAKKPKDWAALLGNQSCSTK